MKGNQKIPASNIEIKTNGTGYGVLFVNGHEVPGVISIDTSKIMARDELQSITIVLHVSEFSVCRLDGYEPGKRQ